MVARTLKQRKAVALDALANMFYAHQVTCGTGYAAEIPQVRDAMLTAQDDTALLDAIEALGLRDSVLNSFYRKADAFDAVVARVRAQGDFDKELTTS